jgi:hypothetical protein
MKKEKAAMTNPEPNSDTAARGCSPHTAFTSSAMLLRNSGAYSGEVRRDWSRRFQAM